MIRYGDSRCGFFPWVVMHMTDSPMRPRPPLYSLADEAREALLEETANRLLQACPAPKHTDYPCCRDYRMAELAAHGRRIVAAPDPARQVGEDRRRLVLRLLSRLDLTRRQRLAFRLTSRGLPREQVAALLGVTPRTVANLNWQTCRRLRRALRRRGDHLLPPMFALRETYRQEVNRRGYTPEKHCRLGQEECRLTGVCPRRWYLYFTEDQAEAPEGEW